MLRIFVAVLLNLVVFYELKHNIFIVAQSNITYATINNRANVTSAFSQNDTYRLPNIIKPFEYSLDLTAYLDDNSDKNFTFEGVVKISFFLKTTTKVITLHSQDLEVTGMKFSNLTREINYLHWKNESRTNFLIVTAGKEDLMPANYTLTVRYRGKLSDDGCGFYKNFYDDENGKIRWLAATHLEPIAARRLFPCFDEPEYKAHFNLRINHHQKYSVISNTKIKAQTWVDAKDRVLTIFEETPRMSTYNLAFIISNFSTITNIESGHSIHGRYDALKKIGFVLQHETKIFKKYEEILKIPFAINKVDLVAIPSFIKAAMENWGSIFFKESGFLYDAKLSTTLEKMNNIITISHEFAHQWFGNLVTCKWWSDLWLQEGLSSFLENDILIDAYPKWRSHYYFFDAFYFFTTVYKDSVPSTHPVVREASSPKEIEAMFDTITYHKGAIITKMMQSFLTKKVFRKGLTSFLERYKYSVADTDDFLKTMQTVMNKESYHMEYDLKTVMDAWINREGYPIIKVTRDYQTQTVKIEQKNVITLYAPAEEKRNYTWHIPINYATEKSHNFNETTPDLWLRNFSDSIQISAASEHWIILNKQLTGYYRVNYDRTNWKMLCNYLKSPNRKKIHVMNRVQLLMDAEFFNVIGFLDTYIVLDLIDGLKYETEDFVFIFGFRIISYYDDKLINTKYYLKYQKVLKSVVKQVIELIESKKTGDEVSVENISEDFGIAWICKFGTPVYLLKMFKKLKSWLYNETVEPDLNFPTIICGLKYAEWEMKKKLLNKVIENKKLCERSIIWKAVISISDEKSLRYIINATLNNHLSYYEVVGTYKHIIDINPLGLDTFLDVLFEQTNLITSLLGTKNMIAIAELIVAKISNLEQLTKFQLIVTSKFPTKNDASFASAGFDEKNEWLKSNDELLKTWFQGNQS